MFKKVGRVISNKYFIQHRYFFTIFLLFFSVFTNIGYKMIQKKSFYLKSLASELVNNVVVTLVKKIYYTNQSFVVLQLVNKFAIEFDCKTIIYFSFVRLPLDKYLMYWKNL